MGVFCASALTGRQLSEVSIPVTASLESSAAAIVLGDEWDDFSNDEITAILSKNVLTDGRGVELLNLRGFRGETCATIEKTFANGVTERFTEDDVNGEFKNCSRAASMDIYYEGDAYLLKPDADTRIVSNLISGDNVHGPSSVLAQRNGKRMAIDGYLMPNQAQTASKRHQLISIFQWLSDDSIPVVIKKSIKVVPFVRGKDGNINVIMLCNAHFDATETFDVEIKSNSDFFFVGKDGKLLPADQRHENGTTYLTVKNIERWDYVLLVSR